MYCWHIASHGHACCLSLQHAYLTPGRGVVNTSGRVSTPVYCWCIASHGHACYPSLQQAHTLDFKNHHKIAAYLTPGRGLVKIRFRVSTLVYCWCIASHGHACCPSLQPCSHLTYYKSPQICKHLKIQNYV